MNFKKHKVMKTQILFIIILIIGTGCASSRKVSEAYQNRKVKFGVEAGANNGGIVENTDLSKVENAPVDGFTGATSMGFHAGAHATIPVGRNDLQAGINYMFSPQKFTYNDAVNGYFGAREISLSQLVVPVTYNINLFKRKLDPGTLSLKLGGALEYNMPSIRDEGSHLTDYSIKKISGGVTLGISTMPIRFSDQSRLGLSFDLYKGTQIFDDFYNRAEYEMPTSSYMKLSIIYQFK
jgi:Outer membrane protein beta-barrel domain